MICQQMWEGWRFFFKFCSGDKFCYESNCYLGIISGLFIHSNFIFDTLGQLSWLQLKLSALCSEEGSGWSFIQANNDLD